MKWLKLVEAHAHSVAHLSVSVCMSGLIIAVMRFLVALMSTLSCRTSASQPAGIDECLPPSAKRVRRFHDTTEEELEVASKGIVPKNTKGNNRWALNNFEAWRASHNASHADSPCPDNILLTCTAEELDTWLSRFVMETRKEDGTRFPARSIKLLLSGLQRYMRASSPTPFNIFDKSDNRFRRFRGTRDTVFKELLADGVGAVIHHHEPFSLDEEDALWHAGVLGTNTPQTLQRAVFYYAGKTLCLRGGEEHRSLRRSQFVELEDSFKYIEHGSKTRRGGFNQLHLQGKSVVIYRDTSAGHRCFYSILKLYISKLPPSPDSKANDDVFYLQAFTKVPNDPAEPWYYSTPVGKNKLNGMVRKMCDEAGLKPKTNHSLRTTGATALVDAGVPEKLVEEVTGRRSLECLRRYEHTTEQQQRAVSRSMTSGQRFSPGTTASGSV